MLRRILHRSVWKSLWRCQKTEQRQQTFGEYMCRPCDSTIQSARFINSLVKGLMHNEGQDLLDDTSPTITKEQTREKLNSLTEEEQKQLNVLKLEHQVKLHMGELVPSEMKEEWWTEIMACQSQAGRLKLYRYFRKIEVTTLGVAKKKAKVAIKQAEREIIRKEEQNNRDPDWTKNTIFFLVLPGRMNMFYNWRVAQSMVYGPHLIIDCDFEEHMNRNCLSSLSRQIIQGFSYVRGKDINPFYLVLCNMFRGCTLAKYLNGQSRVRGDAKGSIDDFMFTSTACDYLDLYDKDRLVYLTADSANVLREYDPNDVYIIGGIVDYRAIMPLTLAKAKEQKIRTAKLPLDKYLQWSQGTKNLTIDQVIKIMSIMKQTGDWNKAFAAVPTRKYLQT